MKLVFFSLLLIKTALAYEGNSKISCTPTITLIDAKEEFNKKKNEEKEMLQKQKKKQKKIGIVAQKNNNQGNQLNKDKGVKQVINNNKTRALAETDPEIDEYEEIGKNYYQVALSCIMEGLNFKSDLEFKFNCPLESTSFTIKYFIESNLESESDINFKERFGNDNIFMGETLNHIFETKEDIFLHLDNEGCNLIANHRSRLLLYMANILIITFFI